MKPLITTLCWIALASSLSIVSIANAQHTEGAGQQKLPREYWVATISGEGVQSKEQSRIVQQMLGRMQEIVSKKPDLICLPELFAQMQFGDGPSIRAAAEKSQSEIVDPLAKFAREHECNIVCPVYVIDSGSIYNSALVINRKGEAIGRYDKIHTTMSEMDKGVKPGAVEQKVIESDIGKLGIQICYDIEWQDGWNRLRDQGAEIIVWPSAFGGGQMVKSKAWENRCYVVSSTGTGLSRICDCTGEVISASSRWKPYAIASFNLERAFLHTWPSVQQFPAIEAKYGRKVRIQTNAEEEWSIIESLSPDVRVQEIMKEFDLETRDSQLSRAQSQQDELRAKSQ